MPRTLPKSVNGENNHQVIADTFAKYFANACSHNSVKRNSELCAEFNKKKMDYKRTGYLCNLIVDEKIILDLILHLKSGKASGVDNLTTEHLRFAHQISC